MREDYINIRDCDLMMVALTESITGAEEEHGKGPGIPEISLIVPFIVGCLFSSQLIWALQQQEGLSKEGLHEIKQTVIQEELSKMICQADYLGKKLQILQMLSDLVR